MASVLKTDVPSRVPWVRIPPLPPVSRAWRRGNVPGFHPGVESSILSVRTIKGFNNMDILNQLQIDKGKTGWYLSWPDGSRFDGQVYKRSQDAKRAKTILLRL